MGSSGSRFTQRTAHRQWLLSEALSLLRFFQHAVINPNGGFHTLNTEGMPYRESASGNEPTRQLHDTTRLIHCFAVAHLLGLPGAPMFRPAGNTPGHALEWSRLLVQLWELGGRENSWLLEAPESLFTKTVEIAWDDQSGGSYYTLDWNDRPDQADRFWWPCAEGIGAAAVLASVVASDLRYEYWYRRIWGFVNNHFIDHQQGGWHPELDAQMHPVNKIFNGKPDLYHALQACIIPLLPIYGSITQGLSSPTATQLLTSE